MGFFSHDDSDEQQAYDTVQREGSTSHELVAGAASFMAMRKYEQHLDREGKPQSFEMAKEIIAAMAGAEADKLIETKGLTEVDRYRARHQAEENAKRALSQSGQFGDQQYQSRGFEESQYGGGGYGQGRYEQGRQGGGFDGQGGFPGDQEMMGGRMEGQGYGGQDYGRGEYEGERREGHHRHERLEEREYESRREEGGYGGDRY
ncbi:hypothetical protein NliqN6_4750 [Naganishia liquefaciens]|uniref:Uncharacterized protein n=1 Tax=Naganishia liquefaciens TaxID=104408 RepID=A0A8H3TWG1_9TREE|nr:hypothetical protein NliqN6_4750 [Naganishia liquefaciens]